MQDLIRLILAVILFLTGCGTSAPAEPEGYTFTCGETVIAMQAKAQPVREALGEAQSCTEEPSCAFDGMDRTYYYGGFYLTTYPENGQEYVYSLWFADDSVQTEEGLRIGDTQETVERIYGAEGFNGSNAYVLEAGNTRLSIILTEGSVSSILYEAVLE